MAKKDNIHSEHRERLRKRYIREGLDNFADHEVLELLLHYPLSYIDTNILGHRLLNEIGSFSAVMDSCTEELTQVNGIGEGSAKFLQLIRGVCNYYVVQKSERDTLFRTAKAVAEYCMEQYKDIDTECFSVMLFDVSNKLLGFETFHDCERNNTDALIRRLGKYIFAYNANSYVIVRNALDGNIVPSEEEQRACYNIKEFFEDFNRVLREYFIISDTKYMPVCKYYSENFKKKKIMI